MKEGGMLYNLFLEGKWKWSLYDYLSAVGF